MIDLHTIGYIRLFDTPFDSQYAMLAQCVHAVLCVARDFSLINQGMAHGCDKTQVETHINYAAAEHRDS